VRRFLRNTSLSWGFLAIFVLSLVGLAIAAHNQFNEEEVQHARLLHEAPETMGMARYLVSSNFWQAVMENWQSEYLQFTLYIAATVWLLQRGSTESKKLDEPGGESDEDQLVGAHARPDSPRWATAAGLRKRVYENSLLLVMGTIWVLSWFAHSVTGWSEYNSEALEHQASTVGWWGYVGTSDFWNTTLQNWQSEFLAVGSMVVLSIYLRQRGSPESKPVGAPHAETGVQG
jgi:hypothetical protein